MVYQIDKRLIRLIKPYKVTILNCHTFIKTAIYHIDKLYMIYSSQTPVEGVFLLALILQQ
jgi:hypothetical protein